MYVCVYVCVCGVKGVFRKKEVSLAFNTHIPVNFSLIEAPLKLLLRHCVKLYRPISINSAQDFKYDY